MPKGWKENQEQKKLKESRGIAIAKEEAKKKEKRKG